MNNVLWSSKVLCDIMLMVCCHIMLGRPWQYDRRMNQYTLWVNERKQVLLPLIESHDEINCTTLRICMVNGKQFQKEMKRNRVYFSIIPRGLSFGSKWLSNRS